MKRLLATLGAALVAGSIVSGTATADPPERDEFSPVGDQIACGDTILTVTGGTVVFRVSVRETPSGLFRVIVGSQPKGVTATDEQGTVYRLVGAERGTFTTPDPDAEGGEVGHYQFKLNIIGPQGLFGRVDFRIRVKRSGDEFFVEKGECQFVE